jgi:hypothetical protein
MNLNILNHGNELTFMVCNRKEVIDMMLGINKTANFIVFGLYLMSHLYRTTGTYAFNR